MTHVGISKPCQALVPLAKHALTEPAFLANLPIVHPAGNARAGIFAAAMASKAEAVPIEIIAG